MGDEDLSAIRAKRMAELQARGGVIFLWLSFCMILIMESFVENEAIFLKLIDLSFLFKVQFFCHLYV